MKTMLLEAMFNPGRWTKVSLAKGFQDEFEVLAAYDQWTKDGIPLRVTNGRFKLDNYIAADLRAWYGHKAPA